MRWLLLAALVTANSVADAEPRIATPEPVVAVDDTRTHSAVLFEKYQVGATYRYLFHGTDDDLTGLQVALGPSETDDVHAKAVLGWLRHYSIRLRAVAADLYRDRRAFGPLTIAVQRYFLIDPLAIAPLLHMHVGVETAISSPWASGREVTPPDAIREGTRVDTELSSNGWSLRPATPYVRADLLLCRSIALEIGGGPEAFVPTLMGASTEYGIRLRGLVGFNLACVHDRDSLTKNIAVVLEYRGRARLYSSSAGAALFNEASLEVQRRGKLTIGAFISSNFSSFVGLGGRFQFGGR